MMEETVEEVVCGTVYTIQIGKRKRGALYVGMHPPPRDMKHRHVVLTRPRRGDGLMIYRFEEYKLENGEIVADFVRELRRGDAEMERAEKLLLGAGL